MKRSVVTWWCYFLSFFNGFTFEKQWGEFVTKTMLFQQIQYCFFGFEWQHDAENIIWGGGVWDPVGSNLQVILFVVVVILLQCFVRCLKEKLNKMYLQESEKVSNSWDVEQNMRCWWITWWIQRSKKSISAGICSKNTDCAERPRLAAQGGAGYNIVVY